MQAIEEQKEQAGMEDFVEKLLLPTEKVQEVKNGQQRIVEKKLWPGYLLVKMLLNDDSWTFIKQIPGVFELLGGEQPTALSDQEVEQILKDLESKKETVTHKHKFEVGDQVKIVDGVFVNFMGTVTDVYQDKGRLNVLVSIFGRETQVDDLEFVQVEQVTEESLREE